MAISESRAVTKSYHWEHSYRWEHGYQLSLKSNCHSATDHGTCTCYLLIWLFTSSVEKCIQSCTKVFT